MKIILSPTKKMITDTDSIAPVGLPELLDKTTEILSWLQGKSLKILWIFRNLTDSAIRLELIYHQIMNMFLNEIWQNYLDKRCSMWASFI